MSRSEFRKQLTAETLTLGAATLLLAKTVVFWRFPRFNVALKLLCVQLYATALDPLIAFSGYAATRLNPPDLN
jgi:hypothetical protein